MNNCKKVFKLILKTACLVKISRVMFEFNCEQEKNGSSVTNKFNFVNNKRTKFYSSQELLKFSIFV